MRAEESGFIVYKSCVLLQTNQTTTTTTELFRETQEGHSGSELKTLRGNKSSGRVIATVRQHGLQVQGKSACEAKESRGGVELFCLEVGCHLQKAITLQNDQGEEVWSKSL